MQSVIDVQRPHACAQAAAGNELRERDEQDRGIETTAQRDTQSRRRLSRGRWQRRQDGLEAGGKSGKCEHRCVPVSRTLQQRGAAQLAAR
jgi:hypothetical protein